MLRFLPNPLRFSLRTLLVLVALASAMLGWVASEWHVMQQRRSLGQELRKRGHLVMWRGHDWHRQLPLLRRMLGDQPVQGIFLHRDLGVDVEQVERTFPEAGVHVN